MAVKQALRQVGLNAMLLDRRLTTLSGGQRQQVALARLLPASGASSSATTGQDTAGRRVFLPVDGRLAPQRQHRFHLDYWVNRNSYGLVCGSVGIFASRAFGGVRQSRGQAQNAATSYTSGGSATARIGNARQGGQ